MLFGGVEGGRREMDGVDWGGLDGVGRVKSKGVFDCRSIISLDLAY